MFFSVPTCIMDFQISDQLPKTSQDIQINTLNIKIGFFFECITDKLYLQEAVYLNLDIVQRIKNDS